MVKYFLSYWGLTGNDFGSAHLSTVASPEGIFENTSYIGHVVQKGSAFFQSEILPIAVGSGIKNGARVLQFIKKRIQETNDEEVKARFYNLALKSLAEYERFIERQYRRKQK